jgi:hypothetical protein
MNKQQLDSRHVTDAAGTLTTAGCHIWGAHSHSQRPIVIASMPPRASAEERRRILAKAWQNQVAVEWK